MEPLSLSGHGRLEFTLAGGDGPDDPGEFVGDSNHGLVVSPRAVDLRSRRALKVEMRARTNDEIKQAWCRQTED